jgi:hypothetical protein
LTSQEMEALTEHWKPYRSVGEHAESLFSVLNHNRLNHPGVYYMWSLEEVK